MKTKWIILIVVAVAACAVAAFAIWKTKASLQKKRSLMQKRCAGLLASGESVLVNLLSFNEPRAAALTIANLFNEASCPLRVYVAVYEVFHSPHAATVVDTYAAECKASTSTVFCLKDHIRVLRVPSGEQKGVLVAMDQLQRHLLRSETYTCTLMPGSRLCPQWDELCVSAWRSAGDDRAVLTAVLPDQTGDVKVGAAVPGTYSAWNTDLSILALQMKKQTLNGLTVPAVAWSSSFSFTTSANAKTLPYAWVSTPDHEAKGWCTWTHDLVQSVRLCSNGFKLLHPRFAVGTTAHGAGSAAGSAAWKQKMFLRALSLLSGAGAQSLGWRLSENGKHIQVTARGQLGLCDANNNDEVEVKLGSMGEIYSLQARLELPTE